jgi:hypothetical protein
MRSKVSEMPVSLSRIRSLSMGAPDTRRSALALAVAGSSNQCDHRETSGRTIVRADVVIRVLRCNA